MIIRFATSPQDTPSLPLTTATAGMSLSPRGRGRRGRGRDDEERGDSTGRVREDALNELELDELLVDQDVLADGIGADLPELHEVGPDDHLDRKSVV